MKYLIVILIAIFFISMSYYKSDNEHPSKAEKTVNAILNNTSKIIEKRYPLQVCGEGVAMPGGNVKELSLSFTTKESFSEQRLRKFLIETANILLENIDQNKEIEQFLAFKPFTIKNVQIIIFNHDSLGRSSFSPGITMTEISGGILTYTIIQSEKNFVLEKEFTETYEEARKLVNFDNENK